MTLHDEQNKVQKAMSATLSGLKEDPWLMQRVLANVKGEEPVVKKISSFMIVLTAILILSVTAALAAGFGLFGELSQARDADERLPALEEASDLVSTIAETGDDISIEIGQAYYEGNRVFISYRLTGNLVSVDLHEGAPEGTWAWNDELPDFIVAENWVSDLPEIQRMNEWLDGRGQRWAVSFTASLHDGLYLADGTYLDIIGGSDHVQPDGSIIGWKECEIPQDCLADTLTFKAVLFRSRMMNFQDYATFKRYIEPGEDTEVLFTLHHNERLMYLKGTAETDLYRAEAEFASGLVDMKGTIRLTGPEEWATVWSTWKNEDQLDMISHWNLYQNGLAVSGHGTQSVCTAGTREICFDQLYPHLESLQGISLVPVYSQSGEHPDEAILLELITP